jgi:hypothetical protein
VLQQQQQQQHRLFIGRRIRSCIGNVSGHQGCVQ